MTIFTVLSDSLATEQRLRRHWQEVDTPARATLPELRWLQFLALPQLSAEDEKEGHRAGHNEYLLVALLETQLRQGPFLSFVKKQPWLHLLLLTAGPLPEHLPYAHQIIHLGQEDDFPRRLLPLLKFLAQLDQRNNFQLQQRMHTLLADMEERLDSLQQVMNQTTLPSPLATKKLQNLRLAKNYQPGTELFSEFFDIFQQGQQLIFFISSTNSHRLAAMIIDGILIRQEAQNPLLDPDEILNYFQARIHQFHAENTHTTSPTETHFLIGKLNLITLHFSGVLLGEARIHIARPAHTETLEAPLNEVHYFNTVLEDSAQITLLSAGTVKNLKQQHHSDFCPNYQHNLAHPSQMAQQILHQCYDAKENLSFDSALITLDVTCREANQLSAK